MLNNRGVDAFKAGRWDEACAYFEQSRVARRRAGDVVGMAQCAHNLAEVLTEQGRYEEAEALPPEARRIWRSSGYAMGVAAATNTLGRTLARTGRTDEGVELLRDAQERFEELAHAPVPRRDRGPTGRGADLGGPTDRRRGRCSRPSATGPPTGARRRRSGPTHAGHRGSGDGRHGRRREPCCDEARDVADKGGVEWEAAFAAMEMARLDDTHGRRSRATSRRGRGGAGVYGNLG